MRTEFVEIEVRYMYADRIGQNLALPEFYVDGRTKIKEDRNTKIGEFRIVPLSLFAVVLHGLYSWFFFLQHTKGHKGLRPWIYPLWLFNLKTHDDINCSKQNSSLIF